MSNLSKSKYYKFLQCAKALWLQTNKPGEATPDKGREDRFHKGSDVGDLAMGLLGPFVEVTTKKDERSLDYSAMIQKTKDCLANGTENIAEASFSVDDDFCSVDILHKTPDGYAIYEVKSSAYHTDVKTQKESCKKYASDIAYQKWVLTKCGINVTGTFLVQLDTCYVLDGTYDLQKLFHITDIAEYVEREYIRVPEMTAKAKAVLAQSNEPDDDFGPHCRKPYECEFLNYCKRRKNIPSPSALDLYKGFIDGVELYKRGKISFADIESEELNEIQRIQVHCFLQNVPHIDKTGIQSFLDTLTYPLYYLDFETMMQPLPEFQGTSPYQQIPFQYSLHYVEKEGAELKHKEFLGISGTDPRLDLAERLCADIPENVCVLAYHKAFECSRIKELARDFPRFAAHLLNIEKNIQDLEVPFDEGYYYVPAMGHSFSIKNVLPALFPDDSELDYHRLEDVHDGTEAMNVFPEIRNMSPEKQAKTRASLLSYCKLDTLAMVKVLEKLRNAVK